MAKVAITKLSNGVEVPYIGMGTFRSKDNELEIAVKSAVEIGYTSFDTAWIYENENQVANGIKASSKKREELFITSKLWNQFQGYQSTLDAFEVSLKLLDTDYVDLYLIHWPGKGRFVDTWKAFEKLYKEKRIRAIGVSNFLTHHLDELLPKCEIIPMANQIEAHPYYMDYKTIEYCQERSILMEAWSPLGFGSPLLKEQTLIDIGKAYGKTSAQVTLRFLIQKGIRVIPKSVNPERQKENLNIFDFELSAKDITQIEKLNTGKRLGDDPDKFLW